MTIDEIIDGIEHMLAEYNLIAEPYRYNGNTLSYIIEWGDWRHDHMALDNLVSENFHPKSVREVVTEDDGSDTYSSIHTYKF